MIFSQLANDSCGNITFYLKGTLDYETGLPMKHDLLSMSKNHPQAQITLDFEGVEFIGSSGIGKFAQMVQEVNELIPQKISMQNVSYQFIKVFKLYIAELEKIGLELPEIEENQKFLKVA